jgi:hypothetical protein
MGKLQLKHQSESVMELSELTFKVLNGHMKTLPKVISLNLEKATLADYHALFQLVRYRSVGHKLENTLPGASEIQNVRNKVSSGEFSEALQLAKAMDLNDPEVRIEIGRVHVFLGQFEQACVALQPVIENADVPANTRGVAAQLIGHAQMDMGLLSDAKKSLNTAQSLAQVSENVVGSISVLLFHSRIAAFEGRNEESLLFLDHAYDEIVGLGSFRWLLGYYRHRSHASFFAGKESCFTEARIGILLSRSLGDELFECRGILEMALMAKKFGLSFNLEGLRNKIETLAARSESDLGRWAEMIFSQTAPHHYSAEKFFSESEKQRRTESTAVLPDLNQTMAWIYDRGTQTLIALASAEFSRFPESSPFGRILIALQREKKGIDTSALFEEVWNLSWSPERHQNLIDVTLHRFNKLTKGVKLLREQGVIRLESPGIIL